MVDSNKRYRFFSGTNMVDAAGITAGDFVKRAANRGFTVDPDTGDVVVGQGSVLVDRFRSAIAKHDQSLDPFTARGKAVQAEKRKLLWHIHDSGGRAYVKAEEGGGTSLYWDGGTDFRGRPMRHPLKLATSARDGLTVDDFIPDDASPYGFTAPEIKEGVMADNFAKFYRVLTGKVSAAELTPDEQEAVDYYDKVTEAGSIVSGGRKEEN